MFVDEMSVNKMSVDETSVNTGKYEPPKGSR